MRSVLLIFLMSVGLLASCSKRKDFPDTPVIRFESVKLERVPDSLDRMMTTIYFTDGNGDLGLTSQERLTDPVYKFNPDSKDSTKYNLRSYNFFLVLFAENQFGNFDTLRPFTAVISTNSPSPGLLKTVSISENGAFQPTEDMQKGQPLEGYITYLAQDFLFYEPRATQLQNRGRVIPGKRYFVRVRIMDRAGNISNAVVSDTLTFPFS